MAKLKTVEALDRVVSEVMMPPGAVLCSDWSVDEAVRRLRAGPAEADTGGGRGTGVLYFYVLDNGGKLVGVAAARKLLLSAGTARVEEIMERCVVTVGEKETLFAACEVFAMHRLLAIPVVDKERRLKGVVDVSLYTDEMFDLAERKAADEVFHQMIGLRAATTCSAKVWKGYTLRMPWLACNIAGGLACALLAAWFDVVIKEVVVVALFIPVMLTLAESVSIQSMTLAIQSAVGGKLQRGVGRELATALLLAVTSGVVVGLVAMLWSGPRSVPAVVGVAIAVNMMLAAALGNIVPKVVMRMKLNPTVASGPMVLALADMAAITVYLAGAMWALTGK